MALARRARVTLAVVAVTTLVAGCAVTHTVAPDSNPIGEFSDDFSGEALDLTRWNTCHWWSTDGGCTIASNNELQWYQPDNVSLIDGVLRLEARIQPITATNGASYGFTSGMVTTGPTSSEGQAKFAFTYGTATARIRVPAGAEFWPAFWLLPASTISRPEIDIMEVHGDQPYVNDVHLHGFGTDGDRLSFNDSFATPDLTAGWHEFGVHWEPDQITWLLDGQPLRQLRRDNELGIELPTEPLYLVLNLAIDPEPASAPGGPGLFPAALEVDWVRVTPLGSDS